MSVDRWADVRDNRKIEETTKEPRAIANRPPLPSPPNLLIIRRVVLSVSRSGGLTSQLYHPFEDELRVHYSLHRRQAVPLLHDERHQLDAVDVHEELA